MSDTGASVTRICVASIALSPTIATMPTTAKTPKMPLSKIWFLRWRCVAMVRQGMMAARKSPAPLRAK